MTKAELYNVVSGEVAKILAGTKVSKAIREELQNVLDSYLKPKSGGGATQFPTIEIDGVKYHYCRFHSIYEPESDMVMSKGKSKGYCKASISKWNKQNSKIKKLNEEIANLVLNGDFGDAKTKSDELKKLKETLNLPSNYNYVEDWSNFNKVDSEEQIKAIEEKYETLKAIKA